MNKYQRYNASVKGRARTKRYRQSEHGRAVRRAQAERYYYDPKHWKVLAGKVLRASVKRREVHLAEFPAKMAHLDQEIAGLREALGV